MRSLTPPLWVEIAGFKALREHARVDLRPLTLLAGANSSGKSSVMQPLLLLKQTLESSFDAGPLLLDGPHVQFTELDQLFTRGGVTEHARQPLRVRWRNPPGDPSHDRAVELSYEWASASRDASALPPPDVALEMNGSWVALQRGEVPPTSLAAQALDRWAAKSSAPRVRVDEPAFTSRFRLSGEGPLPSLSVHHRSNTADQDVERTIDLGLSFTLEHALRALLHIPGLRGHRERTFPAARVAAVRGVLRVQGPFLDYVASTILGWQESGDARLAQVGAGLARLGVTTHLRARRLNAVALQLQVGRALRDADPDDLVDIADVGFGVSTALPVVVALAAASKGQMVYVEQPELHLHPRAQIAMGHLLADAAARGVYVIVETHSRMILRAIQASIAAPDGLTSADVALHWFERDPTSGYARVTRADVDQNGAFGAWPVDFSDAESEADEAWLRHLLGAAEP